MGATKACQGCYTFSVWSYKYQNLKQSQINLARTQIRNSGVTGVLQGVLFLVLTRLFINV